MRTSRLLIATMLVGLGCSRPTPEHAPSATAPGQPGSIAVAPHDSEDMAAGQTVYVPVYSHVYQNAKRRPFNLVGTLSIRNTDLDHSIRVTSIRYFSSRGKLLRNYLERPLPLAPLASADFVADEHDENGSATSFVVEWGAETEVHEPVIEAVMISTKLSQGISFVCPGRVIRSLHKPAPAE